ncbi:hypothetical protein [Streptomyces sp. FH025]|uniref:hypothetical protein n=1 Tax=Streptomyces sp. FH025 TaxID=2815937 RepID=UPI001A9E29F3|nr:hypothetical protein [Streptomyces sp. FH025]MBO1414503.1 hypothetical protein [Streptomyces sp. FH025]
MGVDEYATRKSRDYGTVLVDGGGCEPDGGEVVHPAFDAGSPEVVAALAQPGGFTSPRMYFQTGWYFEGKNGLEPWNRMAKLGSWHR